MSIELKIPEVGESVREVQIGRWLKQEGDAVALDENVVELETDKASMELAAPAAGVIGYVEEQAGAPATKSEPRPAQPAAKAEPPAPAKKPAEQVVESAPEKVG